MATGRGAVVVVVEGRNGITITGGGRYGRGGVVIFLKKFLFFSL
jgi:hypothetical protein